MSLPPLPGWALHSETLKLDIQAYARQAVREALEREAQFFEREQLRMALPDLRGACVYPENVAARIRARMEGI